MSIQYDKVGIGGISGAGLGVVGADAPPRSLQIADSVMKIASAFGQIANKADDQAQEAAGQAAIMQAALEGRQKEVLQAAASDENKWFNKMFGPSAFYRGMQSMAAEAQAGQFLADETERLHRKPKDGGTASMAPHLYAASLTERITKAKTGDPLVDAQIMKSMMPVAQRLAGLQAEKYAEFANVQAQSDDAANIMNRLQAHETLAASKGLAPDAANLLIAESATDLYKAFTTQPESYKTDSFIKNRTDMVVAGLKSDSSLLYDFWSKSGWLSKASPEEQLKVQEAFKEYRSNQLTGEMVGLVDLGVKAIDAIEKGDAVSFGQFVTQMRAMSKSMGIKPPDIAKDINSLLKGVGKAYDKKTAALLREQATARTVENLQNELQEKMTTNQKILMNVLAGNPLAPVEVKGVNVVPTEQDRLKVHVDLAERAQMKVGERMKQAMKFAVVDPTVRGVGTQLPGLVGKPASRDNDQMLAQLDEMLDASRGNVKALKSYIEDETTFHKVQQYAELLRTTGNRDYAYKNSFAVPPEAKATLEPKATREAAAKMFEHKWLGANGLLYDVQEHQEILQPLLEREMEHLSRSNPAMTAEAVAREAARTVATYGVEQVGTKSIIRFNSQQPTLMQQSGLTSPHAVDAAVQHLFKQTAKEMKEYGGDGVNVNDYLIQQNHLGQYLLVPTVDSFPVLAAARVIDGKAIQDAWAATYRDNPNRNKSTNPKNTFLTKERSEKARKAFYGQE